MNYRNLHYTFFLTSFLLHILALGCLVWVNASDDLKKPFIVFGAYSKKPSKVFFGTPRGKPHGHGTKRKGLAESKKSHKGSAAGLKKDQKGSVDNKKSTSKVNQRKGNGGAAQQGGKKGTSNHDMRAASKLGKHDRKKCVKASGGVAVHELQTKTALKKKQKEALQKKREHEQQEQLKKEKESKEKEQKLEEAQRHKKEEERKRLEQELERKQAEEKAAREIEQELEKQTNEEKKRAEAKSIAQLQQEEAEDKDTQDDDDDESDIDDDESDEDGDEVGLEFNIIGPEHADWPVYEKDMQKEVLRLWRPPLGVPRGTVCKGRFRVNHEGKVESFQFVERSKMLIYDLSIIKVARSLKFNKRFWGKEFIINFKQ